MPWNGIGPRSDLTLLGHAQVDVVSHTSLRQPMAGTSLVAATIGSQRATDCYDRSMTDVAARELRNNTAEVLNRAAAGEEITITVHGRPVAALVAINRPTRRPFSKAELISMLQTSQADAGLRGDLRQLAGDTTDDLGPIE